MLMKNYSEIFRKIGKLVIFLPLIKIEISKEDPRMESRIFRKIPNKSMTILEQCTIKILKEKCRRMQKDIPFQLNRLNDEQAVLGVTPIAWGDPTLIVYAIG